MIIINATSSVEISMFQNFGGFESGELIAEFEEITEIYFTEKISINSIYPNPFNPYTILNYSINQSDFIFINIYDIIGNKVQTNSLGFQSSGNHSWIWNATNIPSGQYFIQLNTSISSKNQKLQLIKLKMYELIFIIITFLIGIIIGWLLKYKSMPNMKEKSIEIDSLRNSLLQSEKRESEPIQSIEQKYGKSLIIRSENNYHIEQYEIFPQD